MARTRKAVRRVIDPRCEGDARLRPDASGSGATDSEADDSRFCFTYEDVLAAEARIRPYVRQTPLDRSIALSQNPGGREVYLKLECAHPVRSFKLRGAMNRLLLLTPEERARGVAAISSGNHGAAVAYGARLLGYAPPVVIVPETSPQPKKDRILAYGGKLLPMGRNYDEAYALGTEYVAREGLCLIDSGDMDTAVCAGQGTLALEVLRERPQVDTILVPFGGGGLCVGVAAAAKGVNPGVRVVPVYSEACRAWPDSLRDGRCHHVAERIGPSLCDGMVGGVGYCAFAMRTLLDAPVEVAEDAVREAVAFLLAKEKVVAEPSGAAALAALLTPNAVDIPGKAIAVVVSGGNLASPLLKEIVSQSRLFDV